MDFEIVLEISIFDALQGYCMGYSLCMMVNLQNGLISQIFSISWSSLLHRITLNDLQNEF